MARGHRATRELQQRRTAIQRELNELESSRLVSSVHADAEAEAVESYLDRGELKDQNLLAEMRDQRAALRREERLIGRALRLHEHRMSKLKAELSVRICEPLMNPHRELVKEIAAKLSGLVDALHREAEFRKMLSEGDVAFLSHLRPMGVRSLRTTRGEDMAHEALESFVREALEHDLLTRAEAAELLAG